MIAGKKEAAAAAKKLKKAEAEERMEELVTLLESREKAYAGERCRVD
jgi:hypothetical protein